MREKIVAGNIYHVLNRGVDKRKIFLNNQDYYRFIHDLFEFNDTNPVINFHHNKQDVGRPSIRKSRKLLVEILVFCLMPNHYHLLIRTKSDEGLSQFIKKLNGGYAKYFNEKYKWSSYQDYIGKQNFPSVTQRDFLLKFFGGSEQYKKDTLKWLKQMDF